jgi:N-acetylmuramoyl-L-alanine amidase
MNSKRRVRFPVITVIVVVAFILITAHTGGASTQTDAKAAPTVTTYSKSQSVCLDPGHGGSDPGALSNDGTINERDINLKVALQVQTSLQNSGYRVFMTRTTNDPTMNNNDRWGYCNSRHATIMVSIHHNDFSDDSVDYATALFYKDSDQALATSILNATSSQLGIPNDGIAQFEDSVLSKSTMPSTVSEGFFITNSSEFSQLSSPNPSRLTIEAKAIVSGIETYFADPKAAQSAVNSNPQVLERDD